MFFFGPIRLVVLATRLDIVHCQYYTDLQKVGLFND
jgi:hypothetical protein